MATALLTTKLYVPPKRPTLVPRPRLAERVRGGLLGKLTLLVAPAGFGKTTLLSEALDGRAVAWVSLDGGDSDATRFWSYVLAALDTLAPGVGAGARALLEAPQAPAPDELLTVLLNALGEREPAGEATLVLDDYHVIEGAAVHAGVSYLLEHMSGRLHVVIATRADPPVRLARLRARAELTELRATDLRFTPDETAAFLTELMGLPLSAADVSVLEARTEGWIAGLQLAALAMRDRGDISGFITAFTGSNRFVMDYLVEEVLERLPQRLQTFVTKTSILDRMCGSLCDAVVEAETDDRAVFPSTEPGHAASGDANTVALRSLSLRQSSQHRLEELERANLFVLPLDDDRHWYRYHHLFAEVVRRRLESFESADAVAAMHRRASVWYEQHDLAAEAVQHALAAGDDERAGGLIEQHGLRLAVRGHVHTVLGWLDMLPVVRLHTNPALALTHAVVLLLANQLEQAEARLQDAERFARANLPPDQVRVVVGQVAATRATLVRFSGDIARCVDLSQQALELLPVSEQFWRTPALVNAARAYLVSGDATPAAERMVAAVVEPARDSGSLFSYLAAIMNLARLQALQGRLRQAAATYGRAAQLAPDGTQLLNSAAYSIGLGALVYEWNDLDAAEQHLLQGLRLAQGTLSVDADIVTQGYTVLARLLAARGDTSGARAALETLAQVGRQRNFAPVLLARGAAARAWMALAQGELQLAVRWADSCGLHPDDSVSFPREAEYLTLARVLLARAGRDAYGALRADALRLLDRLLEPAALGGRNSSVVEICVLRALALESQGAHAAATGALKRALGLAAPEGYVRSFVDHGARIAALLEHVSRGGSPVAAYAANLLRAVLAAPLDHAGTVSDVARPASIHDSTPQTVLVEPLTERELEILVLIGQGYSNQAIAVRLVVAVSTVKKHINNLYGKLDVQSRTQALVRARELNLLP